MTIVVCVLLAYLLGSVSFAVISSWIFNLPDPRTYGSGNPGATNVLRSGKKIAAVLTLLGDAGKGWLAVALAQYYGPMWELGNEGIAAVALAVFLGHVFPSIFTLSRWQRRSNCRGCVVGIEYLDWIDGHCNMARGCDDMAYLFLICTGRVDIGAGLYRKHSGRGRDRRGGFVDVVGADLASSVEHHELMDRQRKCDR